MGSMSRARSASSLAPTLLVSMPQLLDPNFARTVILLCEHSADGAFGLVVNRPTDTPAAEAVHLDPPPATKGSTRLWVGGPVEPQRGWILMPAAPPEGEGLEVTDGVFLSTSLDVLRSVIETDDARSRVLTGYAGWGPGQLDEELAQSAWLTADVTPQLVFDTASAAMWEAAIRQLGADPGLLQAGHGVH
jgi:putative transcriptional regulator